MCEKKFNAIRNNIANLIVLFRISLIFIAILLLNIENFSYRILGLIVFLISIFLDYLDGYFARKLQITSRVGATLDMLGDRITENVMLVFFAYKYLFPLEIALFFIVRAFISDYIRSLNFYSGKGIYDINTSRLGALFVASPLSRVLYLLAKTLLFVGGCLILIAEISNFANQANILFVLKRYVQYNIFIVLTFNIIRFVLLIYDSRNTIKKYFLSAKSL
nr:hypothetical protein [Nanoarchaeum sp.]